MNTNQESGDASTPLTWKFSIQSILRKCQTQYNSFVNYAWVGVLFTIFTYLATVILIDYWHYSAWWVNALVVGGFSLAKYGLYRKFGFANTTHSHGKSMALFVFVAFVCYLLTVIPASALTTWGGIPALYANAGVFITVFFLRYWLFKISGFAK